MASKDVGRDTKDLFASAACVLRRSGQNLARASLLLFPSFLLELPPSLVEKSYLLNFLISLDFYDQSKVETPQPLTAGHQRQCALRGGVRAFSADKQSEHKLEDHTIGKAHVACP